MSILSVTDELVSRLAAYRTRLEQHPEMPVCDLLPLIFRLKGKPFDIRDGHFPHEPLFRLLQLPRRQVIKAGRQIAKSTNLAAVGILRAASIPYYNTLTVTPLFEQVRKFSSNYVKPFLVESAVKAYLLKPGTDNSVLQRTLANGSNLFYNYALNSADRIRGTSGDEADLDEVQDFDLDVLPIIESCLDASPYKIIRYSGTPKTYDGPLQVYWDLSSQGIWHIPCQATGCKHVNRCSADGDLLKMIDSPKTLVCSKCCQPLDSTLGNYRHDRPDRRMSFPGYHMPQVIFPMHYSVPAAWLKVQETIREKPKFVLYNEVLGESLDVGLKLMTLEEIKRAAILTTTKPADFPKADYVLTAGGIDWGGKGKEKTGDKEEFISNTAFAISGLRVDGKVDVKFLFKTPYEYNHSQEAELAKNVMCAAGVDWVAHDFGGAGDVRESFMVEKGLPSNRICPMTYSSLSMNKPIVFFNPSGVTGARSSYVIDKARSLLLLVELIRHGIVRFPDFESNRQALEDFLSIYEETIETPRGKLRLVKRLRRRTDDIVHAVNFSVMALFHASGQWPALADSFMELPGPDQRWAEGDR
jgi:hypothetical protein